MDWLLKYWPILIVLYSGVFTMVIFALHRTYAKRDDHMKLRSEVDQISLQLNNLPSEKELHKLELKIERLSGDIKRIEPGLTSVKTLSDMLLENELLNRKD